MRRLFPSSLHSLHSLRVGISRRTITLSRVERRWRGQSTTTLADVRLADDGEGRSATAHDSLSVGLNAALKTAECRRMRTHVVLADELVRYFMVTPPTNAGSLRDCRAAAQMRFQTLYGEPATAWRIEADWDAREPFLACAMPANLLSALHAVAAEHRLDLVEMLPQFVAEWNRWHRKLPGDAWLGVVHERGMTIGAIHEGRLRAVRTLDTTPQDLIATRMHDMLAREALLLNLPTPARLQLAGAALDGVAMEPAGAMTFEKLDQTRKGMPA
jgi:hypothetical protein